MVCVLRQALLKADEQKATKAKWEGRSVFSYVLQSKCKFVQLKKRTAYSSDQPPSKRISLSVGSVGEFTGICACLCESSCVVEYLHGVPIGDGLMQTSNPFLLSTCGPSMTSKPSNIQQVERQT